MGQFDVLSSDSATRPSLKLPHKTMEDTKTQTLPESRGSAKEEGDGSAGKRDGSLIYELIN